MLFVFFQLTVNIIIIIIIIIIINSWSERIAGTHCWNVVRIRCRKLWRNPLAETVFSIGPNS